MLITLAGYCAYLIWRWTTGAELGWSHLGWAALALFAAAAVGKVVGLLRAEARYRRLVQRIGQEWPARPPQSDTIWTCG
jgi:hypothetical protein